MPSEQAMEAAEEINRQQSPQQDGRLIKVWIPPTKKEIAQIIEDAMQPQWTRVEDVGPDQPPLDFEIVKAWNPKKNRAYYGIFEHNGWFTTPGEAFNRTDMSHWRPMDSPPKEVEG